MLGTMAGTGRAVLTEMAIPIGDTTAAEGGEARMGGDDVSAAVTGAGDGAGAGDTANNGPDSNMVFAISLRDGSVSAAATG